MPKSLHETPTLREQDVGRLDVAVDDSFGMRVIERCRQRLKNGESLLDGPRTATQLSGERAPTNVGADHIRPALLLAVVVDHEDVRMIEARDGLGLVTKPLKVRLIGGVARRQELDRHVTLETRIVRAPDLGHTAAAGPSHQPIGTNSVPLAQLHVVRSPYALTPLRGIPGLADDPGR